ncbi:MAG: hypothetical protein NTV79_04385 [Candidatus Aureabacteria bacterium]|nr:hypothetical protein [Candidatus Auribacterota bacterium]
MEKSCGPGRPPKFREERRPITVTLESIAGLRLVEVAPARCLITVHKDISVESIEVQLQDRLEEAINRKDHDFLANLLSQIRRQTISWEDILAINT